MVNCPPDSTAAVLSKHTVNKEKYAGTDKSGRKF